MASQIFKNIKVLDVHDDFLIGAKGYKLYKYDFENKEWEYEATVCDSKNALLSIFNLTSRLFRAEICNFYMLNDGSQLCIAKKGIFRREPGSKIFSKCFNVLRGSRPINLCIDKNNRIYFGEYFANMEKKEVHIYESLDMGKSWHIVYTFPEGNINHVHGLFFDPYTDKIWVVTGDRENECIIANTDDGFKKLHIVLRGGQEYRTCILIFYKDSIIYATDSQYIPNIVKKIDRKSMEIKVVGHLQGSGIYGGQCGNISFFSSSVESSKINLDKSTHLWVSQNGSEWKEIYAARKDIWNGTLFRFGSIRFPNYSTKKPIKRLFFSGRAVKKIDGCSVALDL